MKPKKVCILVRNYVDRDPRVAKQMRWLTESGDYQVTVVGYGESGLNIEEIYQTVTFESRARSTLDKLFSAPKLLLNNFAPALAGSIYWSMPLIKDMYEAALAEDYDIFHANDWDTLPIAAAAAGKLKHSKVIYDSHEFATLEFEESPRFNLFYKRFRSTLERENIYKASVVIAVSGMISEELNKTYGVRPEIIMNCPEWEEILYREPDPGNIKLCHHGGYHTSRGIEELINCLNLLDKKYSLHFRLLCDGRTLDRLKRIARKAAPGRIFFHPPVKPAEIVSVINQYDLGVYLLKPVNFNNRAALPNKFYEYLMAGLGVCIGPLPEMQRVVEKWGCGTVCDGFDARSLAAAISSLSMKEISIFKMRALEAAKELNAGVEGNKFKSIYRNL